MARSDARRSIRADRIFRRSRSVFPPCRSWQVPARPAVSRRCFFVGRERGMLCRGRDARMPHGCSRSIVLQRRLSAGGKESGIPGDDRGLGAGRQQGPSETDSQQPAGVPNGSARYQGRVKTTAARFNRDAGNSGTADGRHVASPLCAPNQDPALGRNPIRADP